MILMQSRAWVWSMTVVAVLAAGAVLRAAEPVDPGAAQLLAKLVVAMNDTDPAVREEATVRLRNLPLAAYPAVEAFLAERRNLSPEQRARIESITADVKTLATRARRMAALQAWEKSVLIEAYRSGIETDPSWDKAAIEAIGLAVDGLYEKRIPPGLKEAVATALRHGCQDPIFLYHAGWYYFRSGDPDQEEMLECFKQAAVRLQQHRAPAPLPATIILAGIGWWFTNDLAHMPQANHIAHSALMAAPQRFARIGPDSGAPPEALYRLAEMILHASNREALNHFVGEQLADALERAAPGSVYAPILRGWVCTLQARYASQIERFHSKVGDHMRDAERWFDRAYEIDPTEPRASTFMLRVLDDVHGSRPDDATREKWFDRALKANPDNYDACYRRLQQVLAQDRSSPEQALAFAERCRQGQNWRGRLPFIVVDAHHLLAARSKDRMTYLSQPEPWEAIRAVYMQYLDLFPEDARVRSDFVQAAAICRQWRTAHEQMQILGDKADMSVFGSPESHDYLRRKAWRLASAEQ